MWNVSYDIWFVGGSAAFTDGDLQHREAFIVEGSQKQVSASFRF